MSREFYKALLSSFTQTISEHHDIDLKAMSKADAYRFITHVQNVNGTSYPELSSLQPAALKYCKSELVNILTRATQEFDEKTTFQLHI